MERHDRRPLDIPVVLGTTRQGRASRHAARFVHGRLAGRPDVHSRLIDLAELPLAWHDAGEAIKDPGFAAAMAAADALVIVAPEYNHGYPGVLKHALDTCLHEYVHKAAGIVAVSAGAFGGTRVVQNLLPVLRELGLVTIFWDVNVGSVARVFDADGRLQDAAFERRADTFLDELVWMARTLRHGRESVTLGAEPVAADCPGCGSGMTHHADKAVSAEAAEGGAADLARLSVLSCAACGGQLAVDAGVPVPAPAPGAAPSVARPAAAAAIARSTP